jgi:hypothetical protein
MLSVAFLFEIDSDTVTDHIKNVAKTTKNYWKGVGDRYLPTEERAKYISSLRQKNDADQAKLEKIGYKFKNAQMTKSQADPYNKEIQVPLKRNMFSDRYTGTNEIIRNHEHNEAFEVEKHHRKAIDKYNDIPKEEREKRLEKALKKPQHDVDVQRKHSQSPDIHMPREGKDLEDYKRKIYHEKSDNFIKAIDKREEVVNKHVPKIVGFGHVYGSHVNDDVIKKEQNLVNDAGKKFGAFSPSLRGIRHRSGEYEYVNTPRSKEADVDLTNKAMNRNSNTTGKFLYKVLKKGANYGL